MEDQYQTRQFFKNSKPRNSEVQNIILDDIVILSEDTKKAFMEAFTNNRLINLQNKKDYIEAIKEEQVNFMTDFKARRKALKFTLRKVEEDIRIDNAYLSQLERGKIINPSFKTVILLHNYYWFFEEALGLHSNKVIQNKEHD